MKTIKLFLILLACSNIFASCKKDHEDNLPAATQTGAGTFGCKINGKVYVPTYDISTLNAVYDSLIPGKILRIKADRNFLRQGPNMHMSLSIKNILSPMNAVVSNEAIFSLIPYRGLEEKYNYYVCEAYVTYASNYAWGNIEVTKFDTVNKIVSGLFNFKYIEPINHCDTAYITEGRFDLKYAKTF